jgi:hypothetical protein
MLFAGIMFGELSFAPESGYAYEFGEALLSPLPESPGP